MTIDAALRPQGWNLDILSGSAVYILSSIGRYGGGGSSMLFHVTHDHTWESCPYHDAEKAKATFGAALAGIADTGAELVGAWVDAPAHKVFLVIDADTVEQVEAAMAPIIDIGCASTRPVSDAAELLRRRTEGA